MSDETVCSVIGARLRQVREACGLTRSQVSARLAGISPRLKATEGAIKNWEDGVNSPPADKLKALCEVYECSADQILDLRDTTAIAPGTFIVDQAKVEALENASCMEDVESLMEQPPMIWLWFRVPERHAVEESTDAILDLERRTSAILRKHFKGTEG